MGYKIIEYAKVRQNVKETIANRRESMSVFEVCMMLCFGFAWPYNLYISIKAKSTKGKNIMFMSMIALAYVFGLLHKLVYSLDPVIFFYFLNFIMVIADIFLYYVNRKRERKAGTGRNYIS